MYLTLAQNMQNGLKKVIRLSGAYSAFDRTVWIDHNGDAADTLISAFAPSEEMFLLGVTALRILGLSLCLEEFL